MHTKKNIVVALLLAAPALCASSHAKPMSNSPMAIIVQRTAGVLGCPVHSVQFLPSMRVYVLERTADAALVEYASNPERIGWVPSSAVALPSAFKPVRAWAGVPKYFGVDHDSYVNYTFHPDGTYTFVYTKSMNPKAKVSRAGSGRLYGYGQVVEARDTNVSMSKGPLDYFWPLVDKTWCIVNGAGVCRVEFSSNLRAPPISAAQISGNSQQAGGACPKFPPPQHAISNPMHFDSLAAFKLAYPASTEICHFCPEPLTADLDEDGAVDMVVLQHVSGDDFQLFVLMGDQRNEGRLELSEQSSVFELGQVTSVAGSQIGKAGLDSFYIAFGNYENGDELHNYRYRFTLRDGSWRLSGLDEQLTRSWYGSEGKQHDRKVERSINLISGKYWERLSEDGGAKYYYKGVLHFPVQTLSGFHYFNDDSVYHVLTSNHVGYHDDWVEGGGGE